MDGSVPQLSLKQQRERTVRVLCEHFARDHLEVEEFEARLDAAHRAAGREELAALVRDLPALRPASQPSAARQPAGLGEEVAQARRALERGGRAVGEAIRDSRTVVAVMSGVEKRGHWQPARRNVVVAVMGGAELDFRSVQLPPGETEVYIVCLMGGVELIVPPDMTVDAGGMAIMGGFEHVSPAPRRAADAPVLRVHGLCVMGGVEIHVRHEGETAKDARLRQREERRLAQARRRLDRGPE